MNDEHLRQLGRDARDDFETSSGNCREIACRVQELASTRYRATVEVREVQMGERRDTHFVNAVAPEFYDEAVRSLVLVDAALDQYCTENQHQDGIRVDFGPRETLPDVAIYRPGAEERHVWYYAPNDPELARDVFTGEQLAD